MFDFRVILNLDDQNGSDLTLKTGYDSDHIFKSGSNHNLKTGSDYCTCLVGRTRPHYRSARYMGWDTGSSGQSVRSIQWSDQPAKIEYSIQISLIM